MKKKLYFLIGAILIVFASNAQPVWESINSPVDEDFVSVCFTDVLNGWILSTNGTIVSTTDGGENWQTESLNSGTYASVHFTDQNHGCIVGWQDSSFILVTEDGGNTWSNAYHVKANRLNDVFFINENIGWAVGFKDGLNYVLFTDNGGQTWTEQETIGVVDGELNSVSFRDQISGAACGNDGMFLITNSGGTMWALEISIPSLGVDINSVFNWDLYKGCAVGTSGTALYTTNGWAQYTETVTNTTLDLNAVSADTTTGILWAVGESGTIIYTPNYLLGWGAQTSGVTENLNDIQMLEAIDGWAVGDNGTILHYNIGSSINNVKSPNFSIFPNPSHGQINIEFNQPIPQSELLLVDITGKIIQQQTVEENMRSTTIDGSKKASGIYFLKIKNADFTITKKVQLL